jgi:hypothetical protein
VLNLSFQAVAVPTPPKVRGRDATAEEARILLRAVNRTPIIGRGAR